MQFKKIELSDKEIFDFYFSKMNVRICDASFGAAYVWKDPYQLEYTILNDKLILKTENEFVSFHYPLGDGDVKPEIDAILSYCKEKEIPFSLYNITKDMAEQLEQMYPGQMEFSFSRDNEDYIYETEALIHLKGKKYHGKRNHINKFKENHIWSYETITDENREECLEMLEAWRQANCPNSTSKEDQYKSEEICAARKALTYLEKLGFVGGAIRAEGKIIAFAIGEPICEDTFVVHFEKAFSMIQGAYPIINQQFAEHEASAYRYINREEDCGEEGLRKAKLSYHPVMMEPRGFVCLKSEKHLFKNL